MDTKELRAWVYARLREPSTYRGLTLLGGAIGLTWDASQWEDIGQLMLLVLALIEICKTDKKGI